MKTLTFEQMEVVNGGADVYDCIASVLGGMSVLAGAAAALSFPTVGISWAVFGIGAAATAISIYAYYKKTGQIPCDDMSN